MDRQIPTNKQYFGAVHLFSKVFKTKCIARVKKEHLKFKTNIIDGINVITIENFIFLCL